MGLDTLKLAFDSACVRSADLDRMGRHEMVDRVTGEKIVLLKANFRQSTKDAAGRSRMDWGAWVQFRPDVDQWRLECSAKVLREDYLRGIDAGTIDRLLETIEAVNGLSLHGSIMTDAEVLRADPCLNVRPADDLFDTLASVRAKVRWPRKKTQNQSESSMLLHNKREECKVYDKALELHATDRALAELIGEEVQGVCRVEYTAKRLEPLARRFGVRRVRDRITRDGELDAVQSGVVYLREVLDRRQQNAAVLSVWDEMQVRPVGEINGQRLLEEAKLRGWKGGQVLKYAGAVSLWESFGRNRDLLYSALKDYYHRATANRLAREIENIVARLDPALARADEIFERFDERLRQEAAA